MGSNNFFERAAWYMTTYTDTLSVSEWQKVLEDVFGTFVSGNTVSKHMSIQDAKAEILYMVRFWVVEMGRGYRGSMAVHKFKKCHRWNDFYDSKNDPEQFVAKEFEQIVARKKATDAWLEALGRIPGVPVEDIWTDPRTREGMRILTLGAKTRYSEDEAKKFESTYMTILSTLTSRPILQLANKDRYWFRNLETLRTEGPLMEELIFEYGDGLAGMKRDMMAGGDRS